ncbi:alpha/beta fold hydrolase [Variovorax sp. RHLX14]|uniref:alpha/beta fold hydrolase n=1 Tax=Variovorax sp. RHLX14 TaxID=1259731 RepID=UPI003F44B9E8
MMPAVEAGLGTLRRVRAGVLDVAFHESGPVDGPAVVLLHGFPYDVHAYAEVAPLLAAKGCRVVVPYLRGFGPTQFIDDATPRSGEQAALASDVLALLDALAMPHAVLAGFDWGSTAACAAAALWPDRCTALVSFNSYKLQNIAGSHEPAAPENEFRYWYQWYFHSERGRAGLERNRHELCELLWKLWSPTWKFDAATYERSAAAFDNPDFVDIVVHSYRHRYGLVEGDPAHADIQATLAQMPDITVPSRTFDGADDGVMSTAGSADHAHHFTGPHTHRTLSGVGHNMPQEAPQAFANAVLELAFPE